MTDNQPIQELDKPLTELKAGDRVEVVVTGVHPNGTGFAGYTDDGLVCTVKFIGSFDV